MKLPCASVSSRPSAIAPRARSHLIIRREVIQLGSTEMRFNAIDARCGEAAAVVIPKGFHAPTFAFLRPTTTTLLLLMFDPVTKYIDQVVNGGPEPSPEIRIRGIDFRT